MIFASPERLNAGGRSESEGLYLGLAPLGKSPANHPWSQTECQHATVAKLIFPQNAFFSHLFLPSVYCCFLFHFPFTAQLTFLHQHTLSFVVCFFWTEMEMENNLFSDDRMPKTAEDPSSFLWKINHLLKLFCNMNSLFTILSAMYAALINWNNTIYRNHWTCWEMLSWWEVNEKIDMLMSVY